MFVLYWSDVDMVFVGSVNFFFSTFCIVYYVCIHVYMLV